eukprot:m.128790 g.128790  ORF g.128790 m.128790 type:complete len:342 (-) comp16395_c0_seq4:892-1917(-)
MGAKQRCDAQTLLQCQPSSLCRKDVEKVINLVDVVHGHHGVAQGAVHRVVDVAALLHGRHAGRCIILLHRIPRRRAPALASLLAALLVLLLLRVAQRLPAVDAAVEHKHGAELRLVLLVLLAVEADGGKTRWAVQHGIGLRHSFEPLVCVFLGRSPHVVRIAVRQLVAAFLARAVELALVGHPVVVIVVHLWVIQQLVVAEHALVLFAAWEADARISRVVVVLVAVKVQIVVLVRVVDVVSARHQAGRIHARFCTSLLGTLICSSRCSRGLGLACEAGRRLAASCRRPVATSSGTSTASTAGQHVLADLVEAAVQLAVQLSREVRGVHACSGGSSSRACLP